MLDSLGAISCYSLSTVKYLVRYQQQAKGLYFVYMGLCFICLRGKNKPKVFYTVRVRRKKNRATDDEGVKKIRGQVSNARESFFLRFTFLLHCTAHNKM